MDYSYIVRKNSRVKNIKLKVSLRDGLVILTPRDLSDKKVKKILSQNDLWIRQNLVKIKHKKDKFNIIDKDILPQKIDLKSINQVFDITYMPTTDKFVKVKENNNDLIVFGEIKDEQKCFIAISKWLFAKAKIVLPSWFESYSCQQNIEFAEIAIRNQKSRWGSCSAKRNISLNSKLLFIPEYLVEYIFLHELCHTYHMNHSDSFWGKVAEYDTDYQQKDKEVSKSAWYEYVPSWL